MDGRSSKRFATGYTCHQRSRLLIFCLAVLLSRASGQMCLCTQSEDLITNCQISQPKDITADCLSSVEQNATELNLGDQGLTFLPRGLFRNLPSLIRLDINNNSLTSLPRGYFSKLPMKTELYIADNPWHCSPLICELLDRNIADRPTCSTPPALSGMAFQDLNCSTNICLQDNGCDGNATCIRNGSDFECQCNDGYDAAGETCKEINECFGNIDCHQNATCIDRINSYTCQCKSGFSGDGKQCSVSAGPTSARPTSAGPTSTGTKSGVALSRSPSLTVFVSVGLTALQLSVYLLNTAFCTAAAKPTIV